MSPTANYVLGCVDANCECIPDCCDPPPPNVPTSVLASGGVPQGDFDARTCCFGPWDTYIKKNDEWILHKTIYCLMDIYDHYTYGAGAGSGEYKVVLTGRPHDWDAILDDSTPECFWEIDPYSP